MVLGEESISPPSRARGVFYGWWLVGITGFVMIVGIVPLFQGLAAWFVVLKHNFPTWSRGEMSWAFAVTRAEGSLVGPVEGILVDRLGPRRMVLIGMPVLGVGFLLFSQVNNLWQLYVAFLVMGLGTGLGTWLPLMTAVNSWFSRRRARAIGVAFGIFASGGIVLVPALVWSIDPDAERFGWRTIAAAIGVVIILLAFPISRLVRNRPEEYGQRPEGDIPAQIQDVAQHGGVSGSAAEETGFTWQEAIRTRTFWLISFGHAGTGVVISTVTVHLGLMLEDRGLSLQTIGWVVATFTAVTAAFTFVGGYAGDRVPIRLAAFGFSFLQPVAIVVLLFANSAPVAFLFAVVLGMGFGGRNAVTLALRGVYFGRKAFASIVGISLVPLNICQITAPLAAGYIFDATSSYAISLIVVVVLSAFSSCLFIFLGDPPPEYRSGGTEVRRGV